MKAERKSMEANKDRSFFLFNGFGSAIKDIALAVQDPDITDDDYAEFVKYYLCSFETRGNKTEIHWWKIDYVEEVDDFEINSEPFTTISQEILDIVWASRGRELNEDEESELDVEGNSFVGFPEEENIQFFVNNFSGEYQKSDANKICDYLIKHAGFSQVLKQDGEGLKIILNSDYKSESQHRREGYDPGEHDADSHCWGEGETKFFEDDWSPWETEFESGSDDPPEAD